MELAPLDDPRYEPKHPPINGGIPAVVKKWGSRSQLRWFRRFRYQVSGRPASDWDLYYCASLDHRGHCCDSCMDDWEMGYGEPPDGTCCCRGWREKRLTGAGQLVPAVEE